MAQCISLHNSLNLHRCSGVSMLEIHTPIYGSPFNLSLIDLWAFLIDSYVIVLLKFGLSRCSFSDSLTLVDFMQINVHPRSL